MVAASQEVYPTPGLFKKWYPKFNAEDHLIDHLQEAA